MAAPLPNGLSGVIPHLCCSNAGDAIKFYEKAFGAEEMHRVTAPDGKRLLHAAIRIGESVIFLADDFPEFCDGKPHTPLALGGASVTIHQNVSDCDAAYDRAVKAGANTVMPPADMFWGDRYCIVADPSGHQWAFATHLRDVSPEELQQAANESMKMPPA